MKLNRALGFFSHALRVYESPETLGQLKAVLRIGTPGDSQIPADLFHLGLKMHLRGILNTLAIQAKRDWVWPYWVERQFDPQDPGFVPRSHALAHMNLTRRNWTIVGIPGDQFRGIVDPCGLVTSHPDGWSLDCWIWTGSKLLAPSRVKKIRQRLHQNLPMVKTQFAAGSLEMKSRVWTTRHDGANHLVVRVLLKNHSKAPWSGCFYFSLRPYNPEGISLIHDLQFTKPHLWRVNGQPALILPTPPGRVCCSDAKKGDVVSFLHQPGQQLKSHCEVGLATGFAEYPLEIPGKSEQELIALLPMEEEKKTGTFAFSPLDYNPSQKAFIEAGMKTLHSNAVFTFPSKTLTDSFLANKSHLQIFDRGSQMTPGALTYSACWVRDSAFMLHALDKLGFHTQAEQKIWHFLKTQDRDGSFAKQEGEWDATGQMAWVILQHFKLTGNRPFLENAYPALLRGARWINRKRMESAGNGTAHAGLLPAGLSAEHLGPCDYYYWDNFWGMSALRNAAEAARLLGHESDYLKWTCHARDYWRDIERSLQQAGKHGELDFLPASPYRRLDSGAIGSLAAIYPLHLLPEKHPRAIHTLQLLEENYLQGEGFFQEHFHSGINCYLTAHLAQCLLLQGNPRIWRMVRYLLKHASSTFTWPEAFHPITLGGCMGEGHHGWAAAEWILLLRNLLFYEKGKNLLVTPLLRESDLKPGNVFTITNAPSSFGRITTTVFAGKKEVVLELANDYELAEPKAIHWKLPFEPVSVSVDDEPYPTSGNCLVLNPKSGRVVARR
jgi:hypothetical protein